MTSIIYLISLLSALHFDHCSCIRLSVEENLKRADIVFVGEVLKVDTIDIVPESFIINGFATRDSGDYTFAHIVKIKFIRSLKGEKLLDTTYIMTGSGGGDCGYHFKLNMHYLIYARTRDYYIIDSIDKANIFKYKSHEAKFPTTTICDRTTNLIEPEEKAILSTLSRTL